MTTVFERIVAREIPAKIVYESEAFIAFVDINPQAPVHIIVAPKEPVESLPATVSGFGPYGWKTEQNRIVSELLLIVRHVAALRGVESYRVVINNGVDAGQTVPHLHAHILGGRALGGMG